MFDSKKADENISLFDPAVLDEISKMKEKNIAVEILKKLMAEQVSLYKRTNVVQSQKFSEKITQWKSVALFLIFFLTLGFLCVKHETFTVNIVLEVFGYQFYRCDLEDEDGNGITWMIISRTDLKGCVGDSVYLRPLNNECRLNASTR